jgi:hypothetical protein
MNRVTGVKEGTGESSDSFIFCSRNINIIHNDRNFAGNEIFLIISIQPQKTKQHF